MKLFFWKSRYQTQNQNDDFTRHLSFELKGSEFLRSQILIVLLTVLSIGIILLSLINPPFFHVITNHRIHIYLTTFFIASLLYELLIRYIIQRTIQTQNQVRLQYLRFGNAFEEASIPTLGIWVLAITFDPAEAILGPGPFLYFIFILLGALRLNFRLSLFTGIVSGLQFFGLGLILDWMYDGDLLSPFLTVTMIAKSGLMAMAGLITGIISLEIRKRIHDSFQTIVEHNRTLEEKVQARTTELETLNRDLQMKVQKGVQKKREQETLIIQQSKMSSMGEMIGMIAHQWRQPLSNIGALVGNLQVLFELGQLQEEEFNRLVSEVNEQTQYLSTTITDFRQFLSTTKKLESANVNDLVENALKIIGKSLENKNINLQRKCQFSQPILTFPNELIQVFINILKNAQDAFLENSVESPQIDIMGQELNSHQILMFTDNAGGIPDHIIDKVFDPYFTTKGKKEGTGLGLYMSRTIIETHCHGSLDVENKNGGACFRIQLPVTPPHPPASEQ